MSKVSFASDTAPLLHGSKGVAINDSDEDYQSSALIDPSGDVAEDIASTETATKKDIFLMICINFLSFVCFAIVLPSLWPFIQTFDEPKSYVGWAVAVNSGGTFIFSPILGKWADWRGVKEAIFLSLIIMIGGNFLYAVSMNVWVLMAARFIVGCAAANYAPASAYLSYATSEKDRTLVMGLNSAAGILGFVLGPAIAAALAFLPEFSVWEFKFDQVTSPGYASILLALFCMLFLPTFKDIKKKVPPVFVEAHPILYDEGVEDVDLEERFGTNVDSTLLNDVVSASLQDGAQLTEGDMAHSTMTANPLPSASVGSLHSLRKLADPKSGLPIMGILVCLYLQFIFYTAFTVFETIGTPYTQNVFGWSVTENGLLFAGIGGACILALALLQFFALFMRDRALLIGTELVMLAGFGILISYPFDSNVDLARFLVGVALASIGFSAACALLIAIFSKILADQEQGLMMGYLSTSGSAARMVGPIGASYILDYVGGSLVFLITAALLVTSLILTVVCYTKLITKGAADYKEVKTNTAKKDLEKKIRRKKREIRFAVEEEKKSIV